MPALYRSPVRAELRAMARFAATASAADAHIETVIVCESSGWLCIETTPEASP
jgi:hypothetical protein